MRLGEPDAFPGGDLYLRDAARDADAWRPWRACGTLKQQMRGAILMGVAFFALVVLAAAVGRVIRVVNLFAPPSAAESTSVASAAR